MASSVHDVFCAEIVGEILRQLKIFQEQDGSLAVFAKEIKHFATSRLLIPIESSGMLKAYSKREPDASFGHRLAHYPGVIIEVCYSQKSQRAAYLAEEYILDTDGSVNAVLILDVDYRGSQKATVTMWRPVYKIHDGVEEFPAVVVIESQQFRSDKGFPVECFRISLSLKDFATEELCNGVHGSDGCITLTSSQLCKFLSDAESRQKSQNEISGSVNQVRPGALKRRRVRSPPEQPSSDDKKAGPVGQNSKRERYSGDYYPESCSEDSKN
ncbi:hypothetical protein POX_c04556 [Penicillium oxalicum]|uniref:hypothetical protein n=1 Tax=Penicillium oxalicum TaxID=69781 RepID=UPI0020B8E52B|nr:hypothetical protein POX_c04556 [Penicillium oxalicum]KAI2791687.1 hypothetical protein POX_c04556 [Penicillium oxalicum]